MITLLRRSFLINVWCVSASPSSHGSPALWIEELRGAAPVPPSCPEIRITCAPAFATPAATVPTPHHDIYSIEDLAQLIYDLKNANRRMG